ncbi:hypothetical protein SAE02_11670 [Skermanella aerolata]|uniref:Rad50/SbcC-type AAA domain-containing protein n=2 Tax=Skermanella aerolata TaxID=393310 RepID=A0A512DKM6_9PROT|nr:hypothetical protein N826_27975 [Skermanella aerolata KACC 11604]GEO37019.1 hypothetical protein SAE02_11670 [Skermanella aerolata]
MRLRHLTFVGPNLAPVGIELDAGLNIIYGGSNAGKSHILAVINFMLGGNTPPILEEGKDYESILLGLEFSDGTELTLRRARKGGDIEVFNGLAGDGNLANRTGSAVSIKHGKGKNGGISELLLRKVGITYPKVAATEAAQLQPFSLRHLIPYLLVDEDRMFSANTPTQISPRNSPTLDKNVFRVLLTGKDDSAIVTVPNQAALKAENTGKIELLDEMIAELDSQLTDSSVEELRESRERLSTRLDALGEELAEVQERLDNYIRERREALDQ